MTDLAGAIGELRFTIQVTRKDTGKVEEFELIGKIDGGNSFDSGEERSDGRSNGADRNVGQSSL